MWVTWRCYHWWYVILHVTYSVDILSVSTLAVTGHYLVWLPVALFWVPGWVCLICWIYGLSSLLPVPCWFERKSIIIFLYDTTAAFYTYDWDLCMFGMFVFFSISMASFDQLVGNCTTCVVGPCRLHFAYHWCMTDTVDVDWRLCVFGHLALFLHGQLALEDMLPHFLVRVILLGLHARIHRRMNHTSSEREAKFRFSESDYLPHLSRCYGPVHFAPCRSELSHFILLRAEACRVF